MTDTFSPGEVAERSGFSLDTLRYYERIGLLERVERTSNGHRRFDQRDLDWLSVLRCLRDTGMPIAEMRRYAESARGGDTTFTERLMLLVEHEARVERHIADLRSQQQHLRGKIDWYRNQLATQERVCFAADADPAGVPPDGKVVVAGDVSNVVGGVVGGDVSGDVTAGVAADAAVHA
jgi:DNA-binding transcriptional MerR regulator